MKTTVAMAAALMTLTIAACGSSETAEEPAATASADAPMDMDGPFAASEKSMDEAMKTAVGIDAADTWVRKMIAHHDGAIEMSRVVLGLNPTADVARMAQMTIDNQGAENEVLKGLIREGTPDPASAKLYEASEMAMHEGMMAATGATPSEAYLTKMLAHHKGAVAMSDIALANGATGAVRKQIEETRAEQVAEVKMVEAMLRGQPMPAEMGHASGNADAGHDMDGM